MIFNKSVLKKLLKEAYKSGGVLVANRNGRIVLAGGWWAVTMKNRVFSNEARAAVVELAGELPAEGECWRVDSMGCQVEIPPELIRIIDTPELRARIAADGVFHKTRLLMEKTAVYRMYQRNEEVVLVNETMEKLLDIHAAKEGEDASVCGPYYRENRMYWYTDECSLCAGIMYPDEDKDGEIKELLAALGTMEIPYTKR
ncbi:MAG: hypothetical protein NC300_11360 [Bacteroidales bacterium]|nr:hypothetical protein [Clostridium sp.]MCM1204729.1 hypothetical protein [Bacteroidales bacterium]